MKCSGKVWKFGDHINTDYIAPSFALEQSWEEQKRSILHIHKAFTAECKPGDVIVAGRNFGCGSSREQAATIGTGYHWGSIGLADTQGDSDRRKEGSSK